MNKLFFIANMEFIALMKAPFRLKAAAKISGPGVLCVIFYVLGSIFALIAVYALLGVLTLSADPYAAAEYVAPVFTIFVVAGVFAVLIFVTAHWFDVVDGVRRELLSGEHRKYYVSSKHESFKLLMTPVARKELLVAKSASKFDEVRSLLSDPAVIKADKILLHERAHYIKMSEAKFVLLEKIERLYMRSPGHEQTEYFHEEYRKLQTSLSDMLTKHEARFARGRELLGKIAR